jgi:predicted metal-binding membrane protein
LAAVADSVTPIERLIQRDRLWITMALVTAIGLAWFYLLREAAAMNAMAAEARMHAAMGMAGMNMRAWGASDWLALFVMWAVMMVGMMLPSAAPVILLVLGAYRLRRDSQARLAALMFGGGYVLVWTTFSAAAALGQIALHRAALLSEDMRLRSAALSGVILLIAGVYQWLPLKNRCLAHCQAPLAFLTQHWRRGVAGGLSMGVRHGAHCVGCCWMVMTLLFVLGVMNLVWIAVLAAFVLLEKLLPQGALAGRLAGLVAVGWGTYLLVVGS